LINLVKNALKFTNSGQIKIQAHYSRRKEKLQVSVTDNGAGISAEDIPFLFQKFGKLHRTAEINS